MALTRAEKDARNQQIEAAQNAIRSGDIATAQNITSNLIGASVGGAQAALQQAINQIPLNPHPRGTLPQAPPSFPPSFSPSSPSTPSSPTATVYVAPPPPPKPPEPWMTTQTYFGVSGVKQADPDIIIFNDQALSPELLLELSYEDLSGIELINISRSDIIDGQNVSYTPVKQLSSLRRRYNPNNIIALPELSSSFFSRFQIELFLKDVQTPYFNENGDLVIELRNVLSDEIVEVEIDTSGTISEVEFL